MNPPLLTLKIRGHAEPAGSKRAMAIRKGGAFAMRANGSPMIAVIDDNPKSKSWKREVAYEAGKLWRGRELLTCAIRLDVTFVRPRLKSHYRSGANSALLKPNAPNWCVVKPDALKLARAVEDALTGVVWRDDSQIVDERLLKVYGGPEGVYVRIYAACESAVAGFFDVWNS